MYKIVVTREDKINEYNTVKTYSTYDTGISLYNIDGSCVIIPYNDKIIDINIQKVKVK